MTAGTQPLLPCPNVVQEFTRSSQHHPPPPCRHCNATQRFMSFEADLLGLGSDSAAASPAAPPPSHNSSQGQSLLDLLEATAPSVTSSSPLPQSTVQDATPPASAAVASPAVDAPVPEKGLLTSMLAAARAAAAQCARPHACLLQSRCNFLQWVARNS